MFGRERKDETFGTGANSCRQTGTGIPLCDVTKVDFQKCDSGY